MKSARYTIKEFNEQFPDDDTCLEFVFHARYNDKVFCETCQKITNHYRRTGRKSYACEFCGNEIFPTAGTIFHKSQTPLRSWFYAMFLMSSTRCGISAKQLERELGVTYKTAWRMFKQIRSLMDEKPKPMSGHIEVDETYIGGKHSGPPGRGAQGKTPVVGLIHRDEGQVNAIVGRELINHVNTVEGFWSLVKRGLDGTRHAVSPKYLQDYLNEYGFRYNHRKSATPMFDLMMNQVSALAPAKVERL